MLTIRKLYELRDPALFYVTQFFVTKKNLGVE